MAEAEVFKEKESDALRVAVSFTRFQYRKGEEELSNRIWEKIHWERIPVEAQEEHYENNIYNHIIPL